VIKAEDGENTTSVLIYFAKVMHLKHNFLDRIMPNYFNGSIKTNINFTNKRGRSKC